MQFGILLYPFMVLADLTSTRYCIPMDSPRPILPTELKFFNKGTGSGKSYEFIPYLVGFREIVSLQLLLPAF